MFQSECYDQDMKTSKGTDTRNKILRVSQRMFAKSGFWNVSFQQIADACKIQQPALFYYFKNKESLLAAILEEVINRSHVVVQTETDIARTAEEKLVNYFNGYLKWIQEHPEDASMLVLLYYFGTFDKKFAKLYENILQTARARIQSVLDELKDSKEPFQDSEFLAKEIHDLLLGSLVNYISSGQTPKELKHIKAGWKKLFDRLF